MKDSRHEHILGKIITLKDVTEASDILKMWV